MLEGVRKTVDPFQEKDDRCVHEFLQQIAPLAGLPQRRAVEILTEELLSPELQQGLPKPVFTIDEVRLFYWRSLGTSPVLLRIGFWSWSKLLQPKRRDKAPLRCTGECT